ncbi:NAD(P)/FAD-dependent oxidoreductase [Moraxella oblonga]|uniref:NAD(P)/FAD-dependent oxidoreductase n=1 Tax=Moraxella oblonga TaxID=200413 RepID=UPI00082DD19E|nr:NAD(P)/FAD-dependent oxidoreductase [Moraxella oblonga]
MQSPQPTFDVIIIGAGASGLFCAINAGKHGKSVLVIDHANKAGKKILMSGGGRCNFINMTVSYQNFVGNNPNFTRSALSKFTPHHFMEYIYKHGIAFHEKSHGQLFCDDSSKDILNMLLTECDDNGVQITLNTHIQNINKINDIFYIKTQKDQKETTLTTTSLVIATGGLSIPTLGASGFGYEIARQFGHRIIPTHASLVPMTFTDNIGDMIKSLSGISIDVIASNNKISFELPMLFTHRGLSGPAILQLSNYWQLGENIHINLLPTLNIGDFLIQYKKSNPKKLIRTALTPYFAKKLLTALESHFWEKHKDTELANIKDKTLSKIGENLNNWQIKPSGTEGYRTAEVTRGGVSTDDVSSKTFESKHCQNLYFIGEVLDVAGWLGGYNFHWAWASGFACANALP